MAAMAADGHESDESGYITFQYNIMVVSLVWDP